MVEFATIRALMRKYQSKNLKVRAFCSVHNCIVHTYNSSYSVSSVNLWNLLRALTKLLFMLRQFLRFNNLHVSLHFVAFDDNWQINC
jgi:hypothetical protein